MSKERDILKILATDGEVDFEEAVDILGRVLIMLARAGKVLEPIAPSSPPEVEMTLEQQLDIIEIAKEPPGVDVNEWTLFEKLERDATVRQKKMDDTNDEPEAPKKKGNFRNKVKAVAVEEFADVRRLDDDEIF